MNPKSSLPPTTNNYRILVVDDNRNIHEDFRKILVPSSASTTVDDLASDLFDDAPMSKPLASQKQFEVTSAYQGREALELVETSLTEALPYALAFVDMRMPPGWDGLETIQAIWQVEPELHTVICTAHSDHSWSDIVKRLGENDRLLVIKKPFDAVEVIQCAHAMCEKWRLQRADKKRLEELEVRVAERTHHLEVAKNQLEQEMAQRQKMELELRHAQRMESVGQLAAGIAHEINTPVQFLSDSLSFLEEGYSDAIDLLQFYRSSLDEWKKGEKYGLIEDRVAASEEDADIDYIIERFPSAFKRCREGVERVARIVRAMKEFAHPGTIEQQPANLNQSILTTLEVAKGEYKLVADVETELSELPDVTCCIGDLNQVLLNLVVNAAQSVAERVQNVGEKGKIRISTEQLGDEVKIRVSDTGGGVPDTIRDKIFDPFFTTKEVGKGTGQGLALAHAVVVEKHAGRLSLRPPELGGATFEIRLPIAGNQNQDKGVA